MKSKFLLLFAASAFAANTFAQTQITNSSFENWSGGNPNGWGNSDAIIKGITGADPGGVEKDITPVNVFAGAASIRLKTDTVNIALLGQTITVPGVASLGTIALDIATQNINIKGVGYTDRPDSFSFAYKYTSGAGGLDTGGAIITLTKAVPGSANGRVVIANGRFQATPRANFVVFTGKLDYQSALNPDTLYIQLLSSAAAGGGGITGGIVGSTLWADSLMFIGLDTAFKAYIQPSNLFGAQSKCAGDTVQFSTDQISGYTYRWLKNNTFVTGATTNLYAATTTGNYSVEVTNGSRIDTSDVVSVTVNPLPVVTYASTAQDTVCKNAAAFVLTGGTPSGQGGVYTGTGVTANTFSPANATTGANVITYTYTDNNGCKAKATKTVSVKICTSIDNVNGDYTISVYPNPANDVLNVQTDDKLNGTQLQLIDITGRILNTQTIEKNNTAVNVSQFATGNYIFRIVNNKNQSLVNGKFSVTK